MADKERKTYTGEAICLFRFGTPTERQWREMADAILNVAASDRKWIVQSTNDEIARRMKRGKG